MNYELGLTVLKKLAEGSSWFADILVYEARLQDNLHQERLYGSDRQNSVSRAQIMDGINRLVYDHLKISFNDLCLGFVPEKQQTSASSQSSTAKQHATDGADTPTKNTASRHTHRNIFIGYSHNDKRFLNELHTHLALYIRSGLVDLWDDSRMLPGAKWHEEITKAIQAARVAILLISANFLASDLIATKELPLLLAVAEQEGMTILCVIVGACAIEDTELAQFHPFNASSHPLNTMTRGKRDTVWKQVATRVRDILQD